MLAVAGLLLVTGGIATAAPAEAATTVRAVTIDCIGDSVVGHAGLRHPAAGTATVTLYGRSGGSFHVIGTTHVATSPGTTEIGYSFTLASHLNAYKVAVTIGSSTRFSQTVSDASCAPPVEVPEAGIAVGVPLAMGLVGGLVWWRRRRRSLPA